MPAMTSATGSRARAQPASTISLSGLGVRVGVLTDGEPRAPLWWRARAIARRGWTARATEVAIRVR
jgi:hypothetical protein